jgi:hypothetical protein
MGIPQTVTVAAVIAPSDLADTYAVTDPKYGKGALRTVSSLNDRNNITAARREVGMLVYVSGEDSYYQLIVNPGTSTTANTDWQQVALLPVDSLGNIHINGNLIVSGYIQTDIGIQGNTNDAPEYLGSGMLMDCGQY